MGKELVLECLNCKENYLGINGRCDGMLCPKCNSGMVVALGTKEDIREEVKEVERKISIAMWNGDIEVAHRREQAIKKNKDKKKEDAAAIDKRVLSISDGDIVLIDYKYTLNSVNKKEVEDEWEKIFKEQGYKNVKAKVINPGTTVQSMRYE